MRVALITWLLVALTSRMLAAPVTSAAQNLENRKERLSLLRGRFAAPPGFQVEEVAPNSLTGSLINLTFDHLGRPVLASEQGGISIAIDAAGDGRFESLKEFCGEVKGAQGMCFVAPGDLLVHGTGPQGAGLYRLVDTNGDDRADKITLIAKSTGEMTEHGPHAIVRAPDGSIYLSYGNFAHPDVTVDPNSPSRGLQEDYLLPRFTDPRGHSANITVPGGTIFRLDLEKNRWTQIAAGLRNAYDLAIDASGEMFTCDSDMEWDVGLPWYRPTRILNVVPGADFGWRTGSSPHPSYFIDTLPSVEDTGRGSPVGMVFYDHNVYPPEFRGALFIGDWSRGRIRYVKPRRAGASFTGESKDFILGEPLNVTDLDVGPDGFLYFTTGGRSTSGGLYRVRFKSAETPSDAAEKKSEIDSILDQPMPCSAWGRQKLAESKKKLGEDWRTKLEAAASDPMQSVERRLRALNALESLGPKPGADFLIRISKDPRPELRAAAASALGDFPSEVARAPLLHVLGDEDAFVVRRACEALAQAGIAKDDERTASAILPLLANDDRFVRHAARLALRQVDSKPWRDKALSAHGRAAIDAAVTLLEQNPAPDEFNPIFKRLGSFGGEEFVNDEYLDWLRACELALIRSGARAGGRDEFIAGLGPVLLKRFPTRDLRINRELQVLIAYTQPPGAVAALLAYLTPDKSQEEQVHTIYCLRAIDKGWAHHERRQAVLWFDRAREFRGAVSMEGYIYFLWQAILEKLPPDERAAAEERREKSIDERNKRNAALLTEADAASPWRTDGGQMSFEELALYLEDDPTAYSQGNAERGKWVFHRAKCANCHVFGSEGTGGGPDLSTVVKRLRRREILESIMYPSRVISDQYTTTNVELKNGETIAGLLIGESEKTLTLISATGEKMELNKNKIAKRSPSKISIMPEGLIDTMNLHDLVDLFAFLEKGSDL